MIDSINQNAGANCDPVQISALDNTLNKWPSPVLKDFLDGMSNIRRLHHEAFMDWWSGIQNPNKIFYHYEND